MSTRIIAMPRTAAAPRQRDHRGVDTTKTSAMLSISGLVLLAALAIGSASALGEASTRSAPSVQPAPAPAPLIR